MSRLVVLVVMVLGLRGCDCRASSSSIDYERPRATVEPMAESPRSARPSLSVPGEESPAGVRPMGTVRTEGVPRVQSLDSAGRLAVFSERGLVSIHRVGGDEAPTLVARAEAPGEGTTLAAGWHGGALYSVQSRPDRLMRWIDEDGELSPVLLQSLEGSPRDLRVGRSGVWILEDRGEGGVVTISPFIDGEDLGDPAATYSLAAGPVGFFDAAGLLVVPCFVDRIVFAFDRGTGEEVAQVPTGFRPMMATAALSAGVLVAPSNAASLGRFIGDELTLADLPEPVTRLVTLGEPARTYAFSAGSGRLRRLDAEMNEVAITERYRLITDLAWSEHGLVVVNASGPDGVALLDPDSLMLIDSRSIEGLPARVEVVGDVVSVMSPQEGRIDLFELIAQRGAFVATPGSQRR